MIWWKEKRWLVVVESKLEEHRRCVPILSKLFCILFPVIILQSKKREKRLTHPYYSFASKPFFSFLFAYFSPVSPFPFFCCLFVQTVLFPDYPLSLLHICKQWQESCALEADWKFSFTVHSGKKPQNLNFTEHCENISFWSHVIIWALNLHKNKKLTWSLSVATDKSWKLKTQNGECQ